MKNESVITFIAGAAIGAILGVIFAPAKGEATRQKIREASQGTLDTLKIDGQALREDAKNSILSKLDRIEKILDEKEENYE